MFGTFLWGQDVRLLVHECFSLRFKALWFWSPRNSWSVSAQETMHASAPGRSGPRRCMTASFSSWQVRPYAIPECFSSWPIHEGFSSWHIRRQKSQGCYWRSESTFLITLEFLGSGDCREGLSIITPSLLSGGGISDKGFFQLLAYTWAFGNHAVPVSRPGFGLSQLSGLISPL